MEQDNTFNPLEWLAAGDGNAAKKSTTAGGASTVNGQPMSGQVINHQCCASGLPHTKGSGSDRDDLLAIISELLTRRMNICEFYNDWIKVGWALAEELGAEGRDYFHQLSAQSTKYNVQECERKWQDLVRSNRGLTTGSTIFWLAHQAGVDLPAE